VIKEIHSFLVCLSVSPTVPKNTSYTIIYVMIREKQLPIVS
jgi:hypothetical protein